MILDLVELTINISCYIWLHRPDSLEPLYVFFSLSCPSEIAATYVLSAKETLSREVMIYEQNCPSEEVL